MSVINTMNSMNPENSEINECYESFWKAKKTIPFLYPTEFVVRIFLAKYPGLSFLKPEKKAKILDIGFGDGRNTAFLLGQRYDVYGIEITQGIVDKAKDFFTLRGGEQPNLFVGRNSKIPFEDNFFDCILACHSCYYCDEKETFMDNMREYSRVLKKGGFMVASMADEQSFIFKNSQKMQMVQEL